MAGAIALLLVISGSTSALALFDDSRGVGGNTIATATLEPPGPLGVTTTSCSGGGPPSFVEATSAAGFAAPVTVATPAGAQTGDLLLAGIAADDTNSVVAPGWTLVRQDKDAADGFWQAVLYRFVTSSEPANHTFSPVQSSSGEVVAGIAAYRGVDPTNPIDAHGGQVTTAFTSTITAPSITTTTADTRLVGVFGSDDSDPITAPAQSTTRWSREYTLNQDAAALAADEARPVAGATGSRVATFGGPSNNIGQLVALRPTLGAAAAVTWAPTPSSFASGYTVERWRSGSLESSQTVTPGSSGGTTDGPLVPGATYAYRVEAVYEQWTSTTVSQTASIACPVAPATTAIALLGRLGEPDPIEVTWTAGGFLDKGLTAAVGPWRNMAAQRAPTRDEMIAIGVHDSGLISGEGRTTGQIRSAGTWSALPGGVLGSPSTSTHHGFDVAYESTSGDAMVVWNNGTTGTKGLSYTVWDGSTWSPTATIDTPLAGEPRHVRLAADPLSDEMVLAASNASGQDYALVWDGGQWVAAASQVLDASGGDHSTTVEVTYEQQSGEAMVVYGRGAGSISYRIWDGTWATQVSLLPPAGVTGVPRWTTLGNQRGTDRFALGITTTTGSLWLIHWTGTSWQSQLHAGTAWTTDAPVLGVGFEGLSGHALAVYGRSGTNAQSYRTWTAGTGWSGETVGPNLGSSAGSTIVRPRPGTDEIFVLVQDSSADLVVLRWDGTGYISSQGIAKSNDNRNQPFAWVWQ